MSSRFRQIKAFWAERGEQFEDPEFPADGRAIDHHEPDKYDWIEWKRPHEFAEAPRMFIDDATQGDICQGALGDCWLLASIASLTLDKKHLFQVVPPDQDFTDDDYCGVFRFNFWYFGRWKEVIIDDRLPVNRDGELVFVHSKDPNEMWSALLEKAYAKLFRSYFALKGGQIGEALVDFTGGIAEELMLNDDLPHDAFRRLEKAHARGHLMGCAIDATSSEIEEKLDNGLVKGHAYSLTGVGRINFNGDDICLVRVRNPWGNEREWNGAWGDNSAEWEDVDDEEKKRLGLNYEDDGEFWMDFEDFRREFSRVTICHKEGEEGDTKFNMQSFDESWVRGITAGGCRNFIDTFARNPQFRVTLEDTDDDDDDLCTLIVSVMQKNFRGLGAGNNPLTIGFMVYPVDAKGESLEKLDQKYFKTHKSASKSQSFVNAREVVNRVNLPPGKYCIVPSTFNPDQEGEFHLRILSEGAHTSSGQIKDPLVTETSAGEADYRPEDRQNVEQFRTLFLQTAGDDGVVSVTEIQELIAMCLGAEEEQPTIDHVNALMALFDEDDSGKLDYHEFLACWRFFQRAREVFQRHEGEVRRVDASGLREALADMRIRIPLKVLQVAVKRYGDPGTGLVSCCDFAAIASKIQAVLQICQGDPSGVPTAVVEKLINASLKMEKCRVPLRFRENPALRANPPFYSNCQPMSAHLGYNPYQPVPAPHPFVSVAPGFTFVPNLAHERPEVYSQFWGLFLESAGDDGAIGAPEIQALIERSLTRGEDCPTMAQCYALMALFDWDSSGKLDYHEFLSAWRFRHTVNYQFHLLNYSPAVSVTQIGRGLHSLGIDLSHDMLHFIAAQYGDPQGMVTSAVFAEVAFKILLVVFILRMDRVENNSLLVKLCKTFLAI